MPMSQLNTYLNSIKEEKETNLLPENIINGVTILGVPGRTKYGIEIDFSKNITTQYGLYNWVTKVNKLDLRNFKGASIENSFNGYVNLLEASLVFANNIVSMYRCFYNCSKLKKVDLSETDTSNMIDISDLFNNCYSLEDIVFGSNFTIANVTAINNAFKYCSNLTNETLNNILQVLTTVNKSKISAANRKLSYIGLDSTQIATCQTLSNWAAAQTAGWSAS